MNTLLIFTSACSLSAGFVKYIHRNLDKCINSIWKHENFPKYPLGFFPTKRCFFTSLSIKILPTSNDQFRGSNSVASTRKQSTNICQILIYNFKIKIYLVFKVNMRCYKCNKRTGIKVNLLLLLNSKISLRDYILYNLLEIEEN